MAGRDIKITIVGDASKAQRAFDEAGRSAGTFEGKIDGLGSKFGTFAGTLGGVVTGGALASLPGLLMDGAKGAAEDEAAMLRLQQAVTNTGKNYDDYGSAVDDAIKRGQDLAFTDGETADALSQLISMTGSTEEGMRRLSTAQDLARGTGISLDQAAKLLGKTSDENTAALSRLGIQVGDNATAQDVLNAVDEKYKGQAGIFAESQAGQMAIATQQAGELAESFGSILLPVIALVTGALLSLMTSIQENIIPAITSFVESLSGLQPIFEPIVSFIQENLTAVLIGLAAALLTVVVPAFVAWATAAAAAAAATVVAMAPVIAIAAAVGIAVAALYLAWNSNFLGIQDVTRTVLDFVRPYFETAIGAIRTVVETVFPIIAQIVTTYIGILRTEIEVGVTAAKWAFDNIFLPIQGIVSDVFTTIAGLVESLWKPAVTAIGVGVDGVKTAFDGMVYIQGVVSDIFTTISGLVDSLWNGAEGAVSKIGSGLDTAKGFFSGVYDTFYGYGSDIMQGLIDGVSALYDTLKGWFDDITSLMDIDVPHFSPPYDAGYKQGLAFITGITDGIEAGMGPYARATGDVTDGMNLGAADTTPGAGDSPGAGSTRPDNPGAGSTLPPASSPPGVIGEPASGTVAPNPGTAMTAGPSGGGHSVGTTADFARMERMLDAHARRVERAVQRGITAGLRSAI